MGFSGFAFFTLILVLLVVPNEARPARRWQPWEWDPVIIQPTEKQPAEKREVAEESTRWAVLVAGSSGFGNYRHQADVCHAYQILKKGGLKDENIVVFMYDDIADNDLNPRKGVIINSPDGENVYTGVPKDYTGKQVTVENLKAVILGDKDAVKGGSGKVVNSKPNDRIFLYYSDHGGPGVLGMPNMPYLYGKDLVDILKKKHESGTYSEMVLYIEACESGSAFEGIMPDDLNVYVSTASNAVESSWGTYCPGMDPAPPAEYVTCLGDLYSVAWMEDSETHNLKKETLDQQYQQVKTRTSNYNTYTSGSHVMEYGNTSIKAEKVYLYQGYNPSSENLPPNKINSLDFMEVVNQRDADLLFLWKRYEKLGDGTEKTELLQHITDTMLRRERMDFNMDMIGAILFGPDNGPSVLKTVREQGLPLADDWECLKSMVRTFEKHCGLLTQYGMKHMRAFANICNNGISPSRMEKACMATCSDADVAKWRPSNGIYSA